MGTLMMLFQRQFIQRTGCCPTSAWAATNYYTKSQVIIALMPNCARRYIGLAKGRLCASPVSQHRQSAIFNSWHDTSSPGTCPQVPRWSESILDSQQRHYCT